MDADTSASVAAAGGSTAPGAELRLWGISLPAVEAAVRDRVPRRRRNQAPPPTAAPAAASAGIDDEGDALGRIGGRIRRAWRALVGQ